MIGSTDTRKLTKTDTEADALAHERLDEVLRMGKASKATGWSQIRVYFKNGVLKTIEKISADAEQVNVVTT